MSSRLNRVLIAVQREELFERFQTHITSDPHAGRNLHPVHCLPEQLDAQIREHDFDAVIVIEPRFQDALPAAVRQWKLLRPELQILFIFRRLPNTRALVDLMRSGSFDVLDTEIEAIGTALIEQTLGDLMRRLDDIRAGGFERGQERDRLAGVGLIGESVEAQNLFAQVLHAARLSCPVLISGEPGSGKRLVAHSIHALGPRSDGPIVTVDCFSLSPALLASSLFGGQRGGVGGRGPLLGASDRGTMLLTEVSEMPHAIQAQLQKALESTGTDDSAGSRILSTTSKRMDQLVETKSFRADLGYRLNILTVEIPPLRRHLQDVPLLARYFLSSLEREGRGLTLHEDAVAALSSYHWPGNVTELKAGLAHAAERAVNGEILPQHLPAAVTSGERGEAGHEPFVSSELNLELLERQAILRAMQISGFDKTRAAKLLGIGKTTMYRKLKEMSAKPRR